MDKGDAIRKLMMKDLILNKKLILLNGLIFVASLLFFSAMVTETSHWVFIASLMIGILPTTLITQEDKFKAMTLGCSLPVTRREIVQARFVLSLVLAFGGLLGTFVLCGLAPFSQLTLRGLFSAGPIMTSVIMLGVLLSLFLPFTLRFGLKGLLVFMVSMQVLGVVLLTLVQLSNSSVDRAIVEGIGRFFSNLHASLGPLGSGLFLITGVSALLMVSYLVSVRIFQNREL
jgi:hypothetical protein